MPSNEVADDTGLPSNEAANDTDSCFEDLGIADQVLQDMRHSLSQPSPTNKEEPQQAARNDIVAFENLEVTPDHSPPPPIKITEPQQAAHNETVAAETLVALPEHEEEGLKLREAGLEGNQDVNMEAEVEEEWAEGLTGSTELAAKTIKKKGTKQDKSTITKASAKTINKTIVLGKSIAARVNIDFISFQRKHTHTMLS